MTTFTKEQLIAKLQHRLAVATKYPDLEEAQFDAAIFKIALASLGAEPVNQPSSNHPSADAVVGCEIKQPSTNEHVTQIKPVADLYEVTVPGGRSTTFTTDAVDAKDCAVMGWKVQEYVKLERYQSAMLQGKAEQPQNAQQNIPENIPDGYVLVPVEPTEAMMLHKSGCQHHAWDDQDCVMRQTRRLIWSHMIAAAPKPEASNG